MPTTYQVIALSSADPDGLDTSGATRLAYPDALMAANELKAEGKAFRVISEEGPADSQLQTFRDIGAMD